jgi:hypothetical protein
VIDLGADANGKRSALHRSVGHHTLFVHEVGRVAIVTVRLVDNLGDLSYWREQFQNQ